MVKPWFTTNQMVTFIPLHMINPILSLFKPFKGHKTRWTVNLKVKGHSSLLFSKNMVFRYK